jgi:hypothetical protein
VQCAADAAFRAEQQQVAIRCAALRGTIDIKKKARCHVNKENESKKNNFLMWGGTSHPPPSPSGGFRIKSGVFEANTRIHV